VLCTPVYRRHTNGRRVRSQPQRRTAQTHTAEKE